MIITTAFWVVPTDSMNKFWNRHSNYTKIEANLNEISEELASDDETIRNEDAYKMLQHFTNGKIESENLMEMSNVKAKYLLDKISFAIKDNVIKSEVNKQWICAKENPDKMKEALKIFKIKIRKGENYSENIKKAFLMILSVAVRICAMIGQNNELQAFLTAYKCSSEDQSQTPPIMYSFGILPNYSSDYITKLCHPSGRIVAIKLNKIISTESKQNFNFLLKLSEIELTPFGILNLATQIEDALNLHRTNINYEHPTIYELVIAHFYREYRYGPDIYPQVDFKYWDYCNLTNFMLQLMNRVKESSNFSEYFVEAKFSTELEQKLKKFHQLANEYSKYCNENSVIRQINEHQDFLHFAQAVHVNWNPYQELLITLKTFKYVYFCSKTGLKYFENIIERFDQKLLNDLVKEGKEIEKDCELMNIIQSNSFRKELDTLMPQLQTLENFEEIKQNYKELLTFEELLYKRRCTESEKKSAFDFIVILNAELEKAKTFCMGKI